MTTPNLNILVIDNGSQDNSVKHLQEELPPGVELMSLPENSGFAAGCNHGLKQAIAHGYDHALLINNDAFAAPSMLTELLKENTSDIGLLSPKIYYDTNRKRLWFANGKMNPWTLDLQETGRGQLDGSAWQTSSDVDYLLGTCLLVNLAAIPQVGLFDDTFFMYFEDLDWSIRWRQKGYRLRLVTNAHLYHRVAVSTGGEQDTSLRRYHLARSSVIFWRKHLISGNPLAIVLFRAGSSFKMIGRLLIKGKTNVASAYIRGLRDGWRVSS